MQNQQGEVYPPPICEQQVCSTSFKYSMGNADVVYTTASETGFLSLIVP